jgi:superfamily I DNA/RNA helicase
MRRRPHELLRLSAGCLRLHGRGYGNRIVTAVAGSGKTTTIVHGLAEVKDCSALVVAFNTAIAKKLSKRVPAQHEAWTFHSACYGALYTRAKHGVYLLHDEVECVA